MARRTTMTSVRAVLLVVLSCLLAACAGGTDAGGEGDVDDDGGGSGPVSIAVASIAVEQLEGPEAGTVWSLDRGLQGEVAGADAAFDVAGRPEVRGWEAPRRQNAMMITPSYRVTVVWSDGHRRVETGGGPQLGPFLAVVTATRKAAEPVRG